MAQPHDLVDIGLREALRLTLLDVAVSPQIDGAGCLLLDDSAALRYAAATNVPARALEVAEELCAEGPCHEAFAQGSVDYEDVLHEPRWERLPETELPPLLTTPLGGRKPPLAQRRWQHAPRPVTVPPLRPERLRRRPAGTGR